MKMKDIGAYAGILFPILAFPLYAISTDFSSDETVTDSVYLANLLENKTAAQYGAGLGLLSITLLLIHLEWLKDLVSVHAPFAARVARSIAQIAAIGVLLTFGLTLLAVYAADQKWPDQMVRTTGLVAGSTLGMFFVGMAAFAWVIAQLGWKGKFPKWMALIATLEVLITVMATAVGAPGVVFLPTMVWLLVNAMGMLAYSRKSL